MRRLVLTSLAATLVVGITTLAFAQAGRHVKADFSPFASSGISGTVDLNEQPRGVTAVKVLVKGLDPGAEYFTTWYSNSSCTQEANSQLNVIGTFKANPAGNATMLGRLNKTIGEIGSVSIKLSSDQSLQACATIPQ